MEFCLSPDKVAFEPAAVCDNEQLGWPLGAGCVLQKDQARHRTTEISGKAHRLDQERWERRVSGGAEVTDVNGRGDQKELRNMYNYLSVCAPAKLLQGQTTKIHHHSSVC